MKGYLATHFFDLFGFEGTAKIAKIIREETGLDLYVPQENNDINDKYKEGITAVDIYQADYDRLAQSDIIICYIDGVEIDSGVACEIGIASAINEVSGKKMHMIGLYTDMRRDGDGDNHMYKNLMVKGAIMKHGVIVHDIVGLIGEIKRLIA